VDRRIRTIDNEMKALSNSFQAAQFLLDQWQQNQGRGISPAISEESIRTMKLSVLAMRRNLDNIYEILDSSGD
jgi:hypothetical protein